jgi:hypothetical protein
MINIINKIGINTMKLNDFDRKNLANSALKENFEFAFDTSKLSRGATYSMLSKVKTLIKEAQSNPYFYKNQHAPSYLKLVFMAQALTEHYTSLKPSRIVVENEEVQKSEVILAAQDMVNSIQKMIEEVNDMLVKELPALTDRIQSEIGVNESSSFNQAANESLTSLNQTLSQSKTTMQNAMNQLTGISDPSAFGASAAGGDEIAVTDIQTTDTPAGNDLDMDTDIVSDLPADEPEEPESAIGRAKR